MKNPVRSLRNVATQNKLSLTDRFPTTMMMLMAMMIIVRIACVTMSLRVEVTASINVEITTGEKLFSMCVVARCHHLSIHPPRSRSFPPLFSAAAFFCPSTSHFAQLLRSGAVRGAAMSTTTTTMKTAAQLATFPSISIP